MLPGILRKAALTAAAAGGTFLGATTLKLYDLKKHASIASCSQNKPEEYLDVLPTREEQLKSLQEDTEYDVLVIGGGATGTGVALDAATRGLKTALIEREDFAGQTSSKSTKLIHGGVRYLQAAILGIDIEQYNMVKEALRERSNFLSIAPHLTKAMPILLPLYEWWKIPYMWIGIKMYDLVSGDTILRNSYYLSAERSADVFPQLNDTDLKGGIVYFDGQQNDARMCVALALTAARMGANVVNYVEVTSLIKEMEGRGSSPPKEVVKGATVKDTLTGKEWTIRAKCVINATGPFTDAVRRMDDSTVRGICQPSSGVHITLPGYFTPKKLGLLNAETSDGRVVFFLPWQGVTLAGTTDKKCKVTTSPVPSEEDIEFILHECRKLIKLKMTRNDVLSAWSGIRPLVLDPNKSDRDTKKVARNHIIEISDANLVTIAGGKWTTYRSMAEETVDAAIKVAQLRPQWRHSQTLGFKLEGAHDFEPNLAISLENNFGVERDVAKHLASQYGDKAIEVLKLSEPTGKTWPLLGTRLVERYPYIEAEIRYATREYAVNAVDVIARRTRLAFQDVDAAKTALPRIVEVMGQELKWDAAEKTRQTTMTIEFLDKQMGFTAVRSPTSASSMQNTGKYLKKFLEAAGGAGKSAGLGVVRKTLQGLEMGDIVEDELEKIAEKTGSSHPNKEINAVEFLNMIRHIVREKEIMDNIHSHKVAFNKSNTQYLADPNLPKPSSVNSPKSKDSKQDSDLSKPPTANNAKPKDPKQDPNPPKSSTTNSPQSKDPKQDPNLSKSSTVNNPKSKDAKQDPNPPKSSTPTKDQKQDPKTKI